MSKPKQLLTSIFVIILAAGLLVGQRKPSAPTNKLQMSRLSGLVLDDKDARIVGAVVTVENYKFKREVKTGEEGEFEIEIPFGDYKITAEKFGFARFEISTFKVKPKSCELINIHMEVMVIRDPA